MGSSVATAQRRKSDVKQVSLCPNLSAALELEGLSARMQILADQVVLAFASSLNFDAVTGA